MPPEFLPGLGIASWTWTWKHLLDVAVWSKHSRQRHCAYVHSQLPGKSDTWNSLSCPRPIHYRNVYNALPLNGVHNPVYLASELSSSSMRRCSNKYLMAFSCLSRTIAMSLTSF